MTVRTLEIFCCIAIFSSINGCSLLSGAGGATGRAIELTQDALVSGEKMPRAVHKKGTRIELRDESPLYVEWPGYRATIVLPVGNQTEPTKVTLKPQDGLQTATNDRSRQRIGAELNRLIAKVNEVQWLSATKHTDLALKTLEDLESVYPDVTYLGFMRASLLLMRGEQQKAIAALETALREFPENESGQNLYRKLSGTLPKSKLKSSTLLDDDLLDMSSDNITLDTTSTPGAAAPPPPQVDAKPVEAMPQLAMPQLAPPPAPPLPPSAPAAAPAAPKLPTTLPTGAEDAFGDDL